MMDMDELDGKIIALLKENARLSYSDIAEQVGLSRVAVKNRVKHLEERRYILGYTLKEDKAPVTDTSVKFTLDLVTTTDQYEAVLDHLCRMSTLTEVYSTTGECRIHAVGVAFNMQSVQLFANNLYRNTEGIRRLECHVMLSTLKDVRGGVNERISRGSEADDT